MIKNIIFDFGKVLVNYDFSLFFESFIDNPTDREEFESIVMSRYWNDILDKEEKPFSEYMEQLSLQYPHLQNQFHIFDQRFSDIVLGEIPGMYDVLTDLKARGYKLYGLTNWSSHIYETMDKYKIFSLLDGRVVSSEEHLLKPGPEIYQRLLEKYNLKAEESLFTDDKLENILGGKAVGIEGIVFENSAQFCRQLELFL